jgi:N-methylhydantoinase A/oxoprolinase/acetone carboxylase beta subunit
MDTPTPTGRRQFRIDRGGTTDIVARRMRWRYCTGVLSACGMGLADIIAMREQAVKTPLDEALVPRLVATLNASAQAACAEVAA